MLRLKYSRKYFSLRFHWMFEAQIMNIIQTLFNELDKKSYRSKIYKKQSASANLLLRRVPSSIDSAEAKEPFRMLQWSTASGHDSSSSKNLKQLHPCKVHPSSHFTGEEIQEIQESFNINYMEMCGKSNYCKHM